MEDTFGSLEPLDPLGPGNNGNVYHQ